MEHIAVLTSLTRKHTNIMNYPCLMCSECPQVKAEIELWNSEHCVGHFSTFQKDVFMSYHYLLHIDMKSKKLFLYYRNEDFLEELFKMREKVESLPSITMKALIAELLTKRQVQ